MLIYGRISLKNILTESLEDDAYTENVINSWKTKIKTNAKNDMIVTAFNEA